MTGLRAPKICAHAGCTTLTRQRRCEQHRSLDPKNHPGETSHDRGYGAAHQRWRKAVLALSPWCEDCFREGRTVKAKDVHHIDGDPFNRDIDNGMPLCRRCHNKRTHGRKR